MDVESTTMDVESTTMNVESTFLLIDNSGSTCGCSKYWADVRTIVKDYKPNRIFLWNTECTEIDVHKVPDILSVGGTNPETFFRKLDELFCSSPKMSEPVFNLIITTDGQISQYDIDSCMEPCYAQFLQRVKSAHIYYIGNENCMNFGLNIIFGCAPDMKVYVNSLSEEKVIESLETIETNLASMTFEEISSSDFQIQLMSRVRHLIEKDGEAERDQVQKVRASVIDAFKRFYLHADDGSVFRDLFLKDDRKSYVSRVMNIYLGDFNKQIDQAKSKLLSLFDKTSLMSIDRFKKFNQPKLESVLTSTALEAVEDGTEGNEEDKPDDENAEVNWVSFLLDDITFDNLSHTPCVLIQCENLERPDWSVYELKHPFAILDNEAASHFIHKIVEPSKVGFDTVCALVNSTGEGRWNTPKVSSPFTRQNCYPLLLAPTTIDHLKFNTRAISVLFGEDLKIPGNLVLWNFVVLYEVYRKFHLGKMDGDLESAGYLLNELRTFATAFLAPLTLSTKCLVKRTALLDECLWFSCRAVPSVLANSVTNALRTKFGQVLLDLYLRLFPNEKDPDDDARLRYKTKNWTAWRYILDNRNEKKLKLQILAQCQDHILHNDEIILVSGKAKEKYSCPILNEVKVDTLYTMYKNCNSHSKLLQDISKFTKEQAPIQYHDIKKNVPAVLDHIVINMKTGHPFVMCPKTGLHWKKCVGTFDKKTDSLAQLFPRYCRERKQYPSNYMDLVLFYFNRVLKGADVVPLSFIDSIKYVYEVIFKNVMEELSCDDYIKLFKTFDTEKARLTQEEGIENDAKKMKLT